MGGILATSYPVVRCYLEHIGTRREDNRENLWSNLSSINKKQCLVTLAHISKSFAAVFLFLNV